MIPVVRFDNHMWVHSVDFYQSVGLHPAHYKRWIELRIRYCPLCFEGIDYMITNDDRKSTKGHSIKYYLRVGFARELCTFIGTTEARKMKEWLMGVEGIT